MPTPSVKLGLLKPSTSDGFVTADIASNLQKIDDKPGIHVCTSTTRPTGWGANQRGLWIFETDTNLGWYWDSSAFVRAYGKGHLGRGTKNTDTSTSSTSVHSTVCSAAVTVPDGARRILIQITWVKTEATTGVTVLSIQRDDNDLYTVGRSGDSSSPAAGTQGEGGTLITTDLPSAGPHTYQFKMRASATYGGTAFVRATAGAVAEINVFEL